MEELSLMDATAQAELVRSGDASPLELVDAAIERIERLNPDVNAVICNDFEGHQRNRYPRTATVPAIMKNT